MRVVIAAAGHSPKWRGDTPRHLVTVGLPGHRPEMLLRRTVRQAARLTADVHLTLPDDERYRSAAAPLAGRARLHTRAGPHPDEYASTRDLWSGDAVTVLLYGDCFYTDEAIHTIRRTAARAASYRAVGRFRGSRITHCPHGEFFAAILHPREHDRVDHELRMVRTAQAEGVTRPTAWMLLRAMQGTPLHRHQVRAPAWVEVDDATDDFDVIEDLTRHPAGR